MNECLLLAVRGGQRGGGVGVVVEAVERAKLAAGDRKREGTQAIGGDDERDAAAQHRSRRLAIADSLGRLSAAIPH